MEPGCRGFIPTAPTSFIAKRGDGVAPNAGTFSARSGRWSLQATNGYADAGTYPFRAARYLDRHRKAWDCYVALTWPQGKRSQELALPTAKPGASIWAPQNTSGSSRGVVEILKVVVAGAIAGVFSNVTGYLITGRLFHPYQGQNP